MSCWLWLTSSLCVSGSEPSQLCSSHQWLCVSWACGQVLPPNSGAQAQQTGGQLRGQTAGDTSLLFSFSEHQPGSDSTLHLYVRYTSDFDFRWWALHCKLVWSVKQPGWKAAHLNLLYGPWFWPRIVLSLGEEFKWSSAILEGTEGEMQQEIGRHIGAVPTVMQLLYRSVMFKREMSHKGKLSAKG